jgi:hypothetical protein
MVFSVRIRNWARVTVLMVAVSAASALGQPPQVPASAPADADEGALAESREGGKPLANADQPAEAPIPSLLDGWAFWDPAPLTGPLESDRPDFTESTSTVPRGHFQLEGGYTFTYDHEDRTRTRAHTAPELLLRTGLLDNFELRIGWAGYTWMNEKAPGETRAGRPITVEDWSQGGSDQYLGFKWKLVDQDGLRPDFAIIPAITVPTGGNGFSSGDVDPEIKLAWGYDLSQRWALAGNLNFAVPTGEEGRFFQTANSISLACALLDNVGSYLEYYGFYPNERSSDCAHALNGGLTWQLTPNLQLDWRIGTGLNEEAEDFFTGVGFVIRF